MATWNSRGLRGSTLEELINRSNEQYREKGLALIQKVPTPITPVRIAKDTRQITLAYFEQKSTVDYIGAVQGIPVCFDAKECKETVFPPVSYTHLDVYKRQDYVLDLCAAPGGKATELGAKLNGEGLLLANDISNSRAKALLKNLELMGIPNIYVTSETSEKLAKILPEFFDKILVDAPCSGEGMFRKEPRMMADWEQQGPEYYSKLQREMCIRDRSGTGRRGQR